MPKRTFKNSDMDRASLKRRLFRGLVAQKPSRLRAYTHAMDDRPRSINITRAVAAIIIVHLIALGGILLHQHFDKAGSHAASDQAPPQPPLAQQIASKKEAEKSVTSLESQPVQSTEERSAVSSTRPLSAEELSLTAEKTIPAESIMDDVRTTSTPAATVVGELQAVADEEIQAYVVDNGATASTSLSTNENYHHTLTGDSWESVAAQYGTTVAELKKINPRSATLSSPPTGEYLYLPTARASAATTTATNQAASTAIYTVADGDNLTRIAKKHGMSLDEILKLNNISKENAHRIKIGQKLRVHQR